MNHNALIQIVPRLPPAVDGVGDYALNLARQFSTIFGISTRFIVGDPVGNTCAYLEGFPVTRIEDRSAHAFLSLPDIKSTSSVLLHYVGYGYEKRGCPRWLVDGLEHWQSADGDRKLITMFHEVYAFGPIWTSSFWLSRLQKTLASRLARLSSHCLTNREEYADVISQLSWGSHKQVTALPVFSNVGEPDGMPSPLAGRKRRLVVFGNRGHRQLVFHESLKALSQTCHAFNIEEIVDIGVRVEHGISHLNGTPVVQAGALSAQEVSALLSESIVGFFNYPTDYLGKSTIFAAYCAHRLLPVGVYYNGRQADGLLHGEHFWLVERHEGEWSMPAAQVVADNAYHWYQAHTLSKQAEVFASCLTEDQQHMATEVL